MQADSSSARDGWAKRVWGRGMTGMRQGKEETIDHCRPYRAREDGGVLTVHPRAWRKQRGHGHVGGCANVAPGSRTAAAGSGSGASTAAAQRGGCQGDLRRARHRHGGAAARNDE
jgi:hypothetical protein